MGKGKKKSKKQKEKERQMELERLAEEQRLAEIAEQERLEKERKKREEEERIRKEEEERKRQELEMRLVEEDKENMEFYTQQDTDLTKEEAARSKTLNWNKYVACDPLPDVARECEVNTYITEWSEKPGTPMLETMSDCQRTEKIVMMLEEERAQAFDRGDMQRVEWMTILLATLRQMIFEKVDAMTANILQHSDEFATTKNEVQESCMSEDCKFGVWVNLAKNPRIKSIEFADIGITSDLPKSLALASIAIRVMHYQNDHISPEMPDQYLTLGGVFSIELLALPPPPKKVKGWTLRQVTPLAHTVSRLPYPIPPAGADPSSAPLAGSTQAPPLRISYVLGANIIMADKMPRVGWWDSEANAWKVDGISEIRYDNPTRTITFHTVRLTNLAVLQHCYLDLPYKRWVLIPLEPSKSILALETQRHTVAIEISEHGCELLSPKLPELAELEGVSMPPSLLLMKLRRSGLNLCPSASDATYLHGIMAKKDELQQELHKQLSLIIPHMRLTGSKWNQSRGENKCCFRLQATKPAVDEPVAGGDGSVDYWADVDDSWETMVFQDRYVALINAVDSATVDCDETVMENEEVHSTPLNCLRHRHPALLQELALSSAHYRELVRQLLNKLKLFSFS